MQVLLGCACVRWLFAVCLVAVTSGDSVQAQVEEPRTREELVQALERLIATGQPRHISHDEGEALQTAVTAAIARGDRQIERLAQRAATPLVATISPPMGEVGWPPSLSIEPFAVLSLRRPVPYQAEIFASVDGGRLRRVGTFSSGSGSGGVISRLLPEHARTAGLHHVRLRAHVVYRKNALPREIRDLPELVYALYDPKVAGGVRLFLDSAREARGTDLDAALPPVPLSLWLQNLLSKNGATRMDWLTSYCDERTSEAGALPSTRAICAVAYFQVKGGIGQIWVRTGRVDLDEANVRWVPEQPALEGVRLRGIDLGDLRSLPDLLATDPASWPAPDLSVAPEDIDVSRSSQTLGVTVIVRNTGEAPAWRALVAIAATTGADDRSLRNRVVDVPAHGQTRIDVSLPFAARYGIVLVQIQQATEHSPHEVFVPDPTPEDSIAFRIVAPEQAPRDYRARIAAQIGLPSRGF